MLDPGISRPVAAGGRSRRAGACGLADVDPRGRVRLDALARLLQDVAIDDVEETGWGMPEHSGSCGGSGSTCSSRSSRTARWSSSTWCSGLAAIAAGRRWSLTGDGGGRAEVDSVWIHLGPDQRPARIEGFGVYGEATGGRRVSTKLELPDPPADAPCVPWPLRATDIDLHGHLNNAIYWQAVEHVLASSAVDPATAARRGARLPRADRPGDEIELVTAVDGRALLVGFRAPDGLRAVARVDGSIASPQAAPFASL